MQSRIPLSETNIVCDFDIQTSSIDKKPLKDFEFVIEDYLKNDKKVVALNSGTSAIHLALILSGVTVGDEVLCQSFTYIATVNPIIYQNAKPIFIDSEKDTWNMCPKHLESAIIDRISKGKKPKAIIIVHLYGMPAKMEEIVHISKKYNITLIEDAAEALGSEYNGRKCGTIGDFGILSFNNNKILSTLGGGALICNSEKEKELAFFYATQSKEKSIYFDHKKTGYNYRMNTLAAVLGINQFKYLKENIKKRRDINDFYTSYFINSKDVKTLTEKSNKYFSNQWLSCIELKCDDAEFKIERIRKSLDTNNIESRFLWKPMHLQPIFKDKPYYGANVSEKLFRSGLCLPSGSNLNNNVLNKISSIIHKLL